MSAPLVGRTVKLDGIQAKPELNGQLGVCVSYVEDKQRYMVKLNGSKETMSLRPANLIPQAEADGGGGGMPFGMGGIPGMAGMPNIPMGADGKPDMEAIKQMVMQMVRTTHHLPPSTLAIAAAAAAVTSAS